MKNKIKYTLKQSSNQFRELYICDSKKFDKIKNTKVSKHNECAYFKVPTSVVGSNCLLLNNNEIFVSTTYDSLINKDTVDNLYLDIKNKKLKSKRLSQIEIESGEIMIVFVEEGGKKIKKIKFKVINSTFVIHQYCDESYLKNKKWIDYSELRMQQLLNRIRIASPNEDIEELVEKLTEESELLSWSLQTDLIEPHLSFIHIQEPGKIASNH